MVHFGLVPPDFSAFQALFASFLLPFFLLLHPSAVARQWRAISRVADHEREHSFVAAKLPLIIPESVCLSGPTVT